MTDNKEILQLTGQLRTAFNGDPWYGKSLTALIAEVDEAFAFQKPAGQHSILELLWHIITWKEFTVSRLQNGNSGDAHKFEELDWRPLDHADPGLWPLGLQRLTEVHNTLADVLEQQTDDLLARQVKDRAYDFRCLLSGIIQHDIYHAGQIAYILKLLKGDQQTHQ